MKAMPFLCHTHVNTAENKKLSHRIDWQSGGKIKWANHQKQNYYIAK
jgi:hypothetical protein